MPKAVIITPPGPGRPRSKPAKSKERKWWATDREYRQVQVLATEVGVSVQEYVRRQVIPDPDPVV